MTRTIEYRDALNEAMSEEMRRDKRVFLLGEEVAVSPSEEAWLSTFLEDDQLGARRFKKCSIVTDQDQCSAMLLLVTEGDQ